MQNLDYYNQIIQAADFLKDKVGEGLPEVFCQMGTGMASLLDSYEKTHSIPYRTIPHFVAPTAPAHIGTLDIYRLGNHTLGVLRGRFHYYEGYSMRKVVFPIYVLMKAGIKHLILTNAAGSVSHLAKGSLVVINDHINMMHDTPLRGPNFDALGPRFPSMSEPYDVRGIQLLQSIGQELGHEMPSGIYLGLSGPSFETNAEYRMARILGADVIGMSTIPEVIAANHCGLPVNAISVVSNRWGDPVDPNETTLEAVVNNVEKYAGPLKTILYRFLECR